MRVAFPGRGVRICLKPLLCIGLLLTAGSLAQPGRAQPPLRAVDDAWMPGYRLAQQDSESPQTGHEPNSQDESAGTTPSGGARAAVSLDQRVQELEDALKKLEEKAAASKEEKAPASPKYPTLDVGGRIHFDSAFFADDSPGIHYFEHPETGVDPENRLYFRRIRLELGGDIWRNMVYRFQIDFARPSDPEYKDVYLGFTELPVLQSLTIGNHKRPLGLDHLNSSRFNVFMERPLVVEAFNQDARRIGVSASGVSDNEAYNWQYGIWSLENAADDAQVIGDSFQMSFNARLASSPWYDESSGGRGYFHWGVSGMVADPDGDVDPRDTNANEARFRTRNEVRSDRRWLDTGPIAGALSFEILGLESIFNVGPLQITGEYMTNWVQRDATTPGTGPDLHFHGAYVYVAYMLTGEHVPYSRESGTIGRVKPFENFFVVNRCDGGIGRGWGAWQVALRYSYLDLTDGDIHGGVGNDVTLGLNWYFNAHANLQLNAMYGDIEEHRPVGGFTSGHFTILETRFRMDF